MEKIKQWIVAHKLVSIIIASVLVVAISLSIALPLALRDKTVYTVDDTTLANAIYFKDANGNPYTNVVAECEGSLFESSDVIKTIKFNENAYYQYDSTLGTSTDPKEKIYVNESDGTKLTYSRINEDAEWTKTIEDHNDFQFYIRTNIFILINGVTFTFNSENNTYVGTKISGDSTITYTIQFKNGKLVSALVKRVTSEGVTNLDYTWTISYGNATIELPDLSYVGESQWSNALSFENVKNYTLENKGWANGSVQRTITSKVTENSAYCKDTFTETESMYDLTNKKLYSRKYLGSGLYSDYIYTKRDSSTLTSFDAMVGLTSGNQANLYSSIKNSFNKFKYKADEKVYYAENVTLEGTTHQYAKLTFDMGKLMKVELGTDEGKTRTLTYTYGDASVTIPEDKDCIIPIAMSVDQTTNAAIFKLSNISLEANTIRRFVIDISQDTFEANSEDGKCTIDGEFTVTLSTNISGETFEISVRKANGDTVTNSSSDNGGLNFEISEKGKYYIVIKANANCTGSWDIGFAG